MNLPIVEMGVAEKDFSEVIRHLGEKLYAAGSVGAGYVDAVLEREKVLPTGLSLGNICVAIPHTDEIDTIKESAVAIGILKEEIMFGSLVDPHEQLPVRIVFLLAMQDASRQLIALKYLMRAFQDKDVVRRLSKAGSEEDIKKLWQEIWQDS